MTVILPKSAPKPYTKTGGSAICRDVYKRQNYDEGNCLLLDDGEPCVCVQSISYSLMCRWFRVAVLPLDRELAAALLYRGSRKRCAVCGAAFVPKSNRGKYCPDCAGRIHGNNFFVIPLKIITIYIAKIGLFCNFSRIKISYCNISCATV